MFGKFASVDREAFIKNHLSNRKDGFSIVGKPQQMNTFIR